MKRDREYGDWILAGVVLFLIAAFLYGFLGG